MAKTILLIVYRRQLTIPFGFHGMIILRKVFQRYLTSFRKNTFLLVIAAAWRRL